MATEAQEDKRPKPIQRKPLTAAEKMRNQQTFDTGEKSAKRREWDYAIQMYGQSVVGDPNNLDYAKAFIETVQKKYNNNKKGSRVAAFTGIMPKAALAKGLKKQDYPSAVKAGVELLKLNPWEIPTLMQMATAVAGLGCYDGQLFYLRQARDNAADPGDVEILRACAEALAFLGQFDQAIACWERVKKHHPENNEAQSAIASLHTDKINYVGSGKEDAKAAAKKAGAGAREEELRERNNLDPTDVGAANELSDLLCREERYTDAEAVLQKTLAATADIKVRETLEDVLRRGSQHRLSVAERKYQAEPTEENKEEVRRLRKELIRVELEVFRSRSERYPGNTNWKYEFALRLKLAGNYTEAIRAFQEARSDPKRKAVVYIELGDCFVKIKQFKLALKNYVDSLDNMTDRDIEPRKRALYSGGVVAMDYLDDLDSAERLMSELAGMDFSYKDVGDRLEKIHQRRDGTTGQNEEDSP